MRSLFSNSLGDQKGLHLIFNSRLFGFLLGSTITGAAVYYYVLDEYKVANELLTEDIYVRPHI